MAVRPTQLKVVIEPLALAGHPVARKHLFKWIEAIAKADGLGASDLRVACLLAAELRAGRPWPTQAGLAKICRLSKSAVKRSLAALRRDGFVRSPDLAPGS